MINTHNPHHHHLTTLPLHHHLPPCSAGWADLAGRTLQFSVYDFDRFSRNDLIGQVG